MDVKGILWPSLQSQKQVPLPDLHLKPRLGQNATPPPSRPAPGAHVTGPPSGPPGVLPAPRLSAAAGGQVGRGPGGLGW